jgi:formamidopyrimidine-DNA glycosylase
MTGQLVYKSPKLQYGAGHPNDSLVSKLPDKTTRIHFKLDNNSDFFFNDVRKFGWVEIIPSQDKHLHQFISSLGPEPLEIDYPSFKSALDKYPNAQVKAKLLDQHVLAGVGNIYADESLWAAQIHPQKKISEIPEAKLKDLFTELQAVLSLSIEKGGSTDRNYVNAEGKKGSYIDFARVFRREGSDCPRCGMVIEKIRCAGRGTHLCPVCQVIQ